MFQPIFILTLCCVVSLVQGGCFWSVSAPPTGKSDHDNSVFIFRLDDMKMDDPLTTKIRQKLFGHFWKMSRV